MRNIWAILPRLILITFVVLAATLTVIAVVLYFKHSFTIEIYSEWIFITAILYIIIGIIPIYSVITSTNDLSIKYGEYMTKGNYDSRDRITDSYKKFGSIFPLIMVVTGIMCFAASALVDLIL